MEGISVEVIARHRNFYTKFPFEGGPHALGSIMRLHMTHPIQFDP